MHLRQVQNHLAALVEPARAVVLEVATDPLRGHALPDFPTQRRVGRVDTRAARDFAGQQQRHHVKTVVFFQRQVKRVPGLRRRGEQRQALPR